MDITCKMDISGEAMIEAFADAANQTRLPQTIYPDQDGYPNNRAMGNDAIGPWGKPGIVTVLPKRYFEGWT